MDKYTNIIKYIGITGSIVSVLCAAYGYSIKNRDYCSICGATPQCDILSNCKPNRLEGHIIKFLENK